MASINRLLVPVDFSHDARYAAEYAQAIAQRFGAEIVLLHVSAALAFVPGSLLEVRETAADRQALEALADALRAAGVRVRTRLRPGVPADEIVRAAADEGADLIVMGTTGRTGLAHVLLGSVAERVVRRATCPVLTVRDPGRLQAERRAS